MLRPSLGGTIKLKLSIAWHLTPSARVSGWGGARLTALGWRHSIRLFFA